MHNSGCGRCETKTTATNYLEYQRKIHFIFCTGITEVMGSNPVQACFVLFFVFVFVFVVVVVVVVFVLFCFVFFVFVLFLFLFS